MEDFALATENRLTVFMAALGGSVVNKGVSEHVSQSVYQKKYSYLSTDEKKVCDTTSIERVTATILFINADEDRFGKLQKEIHNDHLKVQKDGSSSAYQKTVAGVLRLFNSHSGVQKKQLHQNEATGTEVAFTQGVDVGFGNRRGNCNGCGKKGHHLIECPDKDK